jgi:hypothetical protein
LPPACIVPSSFTSHQTRIQPSEECLLVRGSRRVVIYI